MKTCFATRLSGFEIKLVQTTNRTTRPNAFQVIYGQQVDHDLTYTEAAAKLGEAIMHACACAGTLNDPEPA